MSERSPGFKESSRCDGDNAKWGEFASGPALKKSDS